MLDLGVRKRSHVRDPLRVEEVAEGMTKGRTARCGGQVGGRVRARDLTQPSATTDRKESSGSHQEGRFYRQGGDQKGDVRGEEGRELDEVGREQGVERNDDQEGHGRGEEDDRE